MSGGHWDYTNDSLKNRIFSYEDEEGEIRLEQNPLDNQFLSDLTHDIFTLLHVYDWYVSGDSCKESYDAWVEHFYEIWKAKFAQLDV